MRGKYRIYLWPKSDESNFLQVAEPVFYLLQKFMWWAEVPGYQVVQIYFTYLSHHRYEGFESEVQGQSFSRFTETETLKPPKTV